LRHLVTRPRATNELRAAVVQTIAALGGFLTMYAIGVRLGYGADLAILTAILALTLARRPHAFDNLTATVREFFVLAGVGIGANLVALIFAFSYALGAATFSLAMAAALWMRQFGARAREAGSLLMLPLIALLIVPAPHLASASVPQRLLLAIVAGSIALLWVRAVQYSAARVGFWQPARGSEKPATVRSSTATRFALQMGVALAAAFTLGRIAFAEHAGWVVTTAFIVSVGNRGRGDVAYKSILRIAGALAGTLGAFAIARLAIPPGPITAALPFGALFAGTWLRAKSYAYWALAVTLVLAIVQQSVSSVSSTTSALESRILGILVGALCATAAAWFVLPIRTDRVVMLRLGEALAALEAVLACDPARPDERASALERFRTRVERLGELAGPVGVHHRVTRAKPGDEHPANWIAIVRRCTPLAAAYTGPVAAPRRANGAARKALGAIARAETSEAPTSLVGALERLRESLSGGA
jgi:hypothetical protein